MKDNRRNFIRKSASLAAAVSVTGLGVYPEHPRALDYDREHPGGVGKNPGDAGYTGWTYNVAYAKAMMQAVASA